MAIYEPVTTEEAAILWDTIRRGAPLPAGYAFNVRWNPAFRKIVNGGPQPPAYGPIDAMLDARLDALEPVVTALTPGPGELITNLGSGPVAVPVDSIGGDPNAILGTGVRRIIASTDPTYPLQDGDLLVLIKTPSFFTNFSAATVGQMPAGWTQPWAQATWTVEADAAATGGKVLRGVTAGIGRSVLAWTGLESGTDVDIVARWRSTDVGPGGLKQVVRGAGTATGDTHGMFGGPFYPNATSGTIGYYKAGSRTSLLTQTSGFFARANNTWYRSRFRAVGDTFLYRIWRDTDPEPEGWILTTTSPEIAAAGWAGLFIEGAGTTDIDWVGISLGGGYAPTTASGV